MREAVPQNTGFYSPETERALLGALMNENKSIHEVMKRLTSEDFYVPLHQDIYKEMTGLVEEGMPFDEFVLTERLKRKNLLDNESGFTYVSELASLWSFGANVPDYCRIIRDYRIQRDILKISQDIVEQNYKGEKENEELVREFRVKLQDLLNLETKKNHVQLHEAVLAEFSRVKKMQTGQMKLDGLMTPFSVLNDMTAGLQKGDLIIVAARPGIGKTAFSHNIATHAVEKKKTVLLFSLEMSSEQVARRVISGMSGVDSKKIRNGELGDHEVRLLTESVERTPEMGFFINDQSMISIQEIEAIAENLHTELVESTGEGLSLLVVDYLQLVQGSSDKNRNKPREQEIAEISRGLKRLASKLHIPVIALSQLNRAIESRPNREPMLSDIRESGAIEQDADIIMFLFRKEDKKGGDDEDESKKKGPDGEVNLKIAKHRNGETGIIKLYFKGKTSTFTSFEDRVAPEEIFSDPAYSDV